MGRKMTATPRLAAYGWTRQHRRYPRDCEFCGRAFMALKTGRYCSASCAHCSKQPPSIEITPGGCWLWTGRLNNQGYGQVGDTRIRSVLVHRLMWALRSGEIPEGLVLDHLCRTPNCCNPEHLDPVTVQENNRRSLPFRKVLTHCANGHEITDQTRYINSAGHRECSTCRGDYQRRYRARKKVAA